MDKQRQDEFWEDRLKQTIREAESAEGAQSWDTPSDAVWEQVVKTLEKKRRRVIPLYLLWGSLAAALLLTIGGIWLNREVVLPQGQEAESLESPAALKESKIPGIAMDTDFCPPATNPTESHSLSPAKKQLLPSNAIGLAKNSSDLAQKNTNTAPQMAPQSLVTTGDFQQTSGLPSDQKTNNLVEPTALEPIESLPVLIPATLEEKAFAANLVPLSVKTGQRKIQWWIGAHGGPVYAVNAVRALQPVPLFFRKQEATQWSAESGLDVKMVSPSGWYVQAGAGRYGIRQSASQVFRLRFERSREQQLPSGEWESTFALSVPSSFGDTEAELDLRRDDSTPLQEGQVVVVETHSTQALQYQTFQIGSGFLKSSGRWMYGAGAGLALNVLEGRKFTLTAQARQAGIRLPRTRTRSVFSDASGQSTDLQLAASLGYRITSRWMLGVEPTLRHSLSPLVRHSSFSTAATAASLQLSVHYLL